VPNFTPTRDDVDWLDGTPLLREELEHLDAKAFASINGDQGGAWAPTDGLVILGAGFDVQCPSMVAYGGSLRTTDGSRFVLADGDWPRFAPGHAQRKRVILQALHRRTPLADMGIPGVTLPSALNARALWNLTSSGNGIQSVALGVQESGKSLLTRPANVRLALETHDSATLTKVVLTFRVPSVRTKAPAALPRFRVLRSDTNGETVPLKSTTTDALGFTADANGWISPPVVASGSAWSLDGFAQRLTYLCDQNNVIDKSQFYYLVELDEEDAPPYAVTKAEIDGVIVRERKLDVVTASTANIAGLTGGMTLSGIAVATNDRVLVKDQTQPYQNGIWIANTGGAWTRATDFDSPEDLTPGCFVRVADVPFGNPPTVSSGTYWQVNEPFPTVIAPVVGLPIYFGVLQSVGNIYHSVRSYFDNIVDMRWP